MLRDRRLGVKRRFAAAREKNGTMNSGRRTIARPSGVFRPHVWRRVERGCLVGGDDNKDVVLSFLRAAQAGDHETALSLVAEDVVVYPPRPTNEGPWVGRDHMRDRQPRHVGLYQNGTVKMEVERVVCDGDHVAVQFVLRALTARGEPYENFYFFLFECR